MSNVPYYLPSTRSGNHLGHTVAVDGIWDIYSNQHMGMCAEHCASEYNISREEQDEFAKLSYSRALAAWDSGNFREEVSPIEINRGVRNDEHPSKLISMDKEPSLVNFSTRFLL